MCFFSHISIETMQLDDAAAAATATAVVFAPPLEQRQQEGAQLSLPPIAVHVVDGHGYVWDADGERKRRGIGEKGLKRLVFFSFQPRPPSQPSSPSLPSSLFTDARRLRQDHRIVGAMIGAVAGFKQQNAASGLPLRLLPEELELALDRGWARGYSLRGEGKNGITTAADPFLGDDKDQDDEDDAGVGERGAGNGGGEEAKDGKGDGGDGKGRGERAHPPPPPPSWREALSQGTHLELSAAAPENLRVYFDGDDRLKSCRGRGGGGRAAAASHAVFRDLHSRGYCLTPGANFGAHWLAYPSDPMLYHAQLCVRVCCGGGEGEEGEEEEEEEEQEGRKQAKKVTKLSVTSSSPSSTPLCPTLLAAASRGAHAARKHLLLAYPSENSSGGREPTRVHYLTIAPEAGFGG